MILVLDEPANGLDPQGIHWMRTLLREFADRGGTVLLSSHLLHEVEEVADRLVIINQGRIVADATPAQLLGARTTLVRALDPAELVAVLGQAGLPVTGSSGDELYVDATTGRWLLIIIALIAVAITAFAGQGNGHTLRHILSNTASFTALLLPVLGVL